METVIIPRGFDVIEFYFGERSKKLGFCLDYICLLAGFDESVLWRWKRKKCNPTWGSVDKIDRVFSDLEKRETLIAI